MSILYIVFKWGLTVASYRGIISLFSLYVIFLLINPKIVLPFEAAVSHCYETFMLLYDLSYVTLCHLVLVLLLPYVTLCHLVLVLLLPYVTLCHLVLVLLLLASLITQFVCCRYTTKHLNDETTPKTVKNLLA